MRIGYISPTDPFQDKRSWSGTNFVLREVLENAGNSVEWISYKNAGLIDRLCSRLYRFVYGKGSFIHSRYASWIHALSIPQDLSRYDIIFVPGQVDIVAALKTPTPIVYYTDGTVPLMDGYYWLGMSRRAINEARRIEQRAIDNADYLMFASQWAADSAIADYHVDPNKVSVLPIAAGINDSQHLRSQKYGDGTLSILFSGVDWERKGGQIAVDTVEILNQRGIRTELNICGIKQLPVNIRKKSFIHDLGFLDKSKPDDLDKYIRVWRKSNLLLLPTRAECAGIVFCEAGTFGVPILTTKTGGTGTYVIDGVNGMRLALSAGPSQYADIIQHWFRNGDLDSLAQQSFELYSKRFSWNAWGRHFEQVVLEHHQKSVKM